MNLLKKGVCTLSIIAILAAAGCGVKNQPIEPTPTPEATPLPEIATPEPVDLSGAMITTTPTPEVEETDYSTELAAAEYLVQLQFPKNGEDNLLTRWESPITVTVKGSPSTEDTERLNKMISFLNGIDGFPGISLVDSDGNLEILFEDSKTLYSDIAGYTSDYWGYTYTYKNGSVITSAKIGIATDLANQTQKNHLLYEEFFHAMGFTRGNTKYEDSILYTSWTEIQNISELDKIIMKQLYSTTLSAGMTSDEVQAILVDPLQAAVDAEAAENEDDE